MSKLSPTPQKTKKNFANNTDKVTETFRLHLLGDVKIATTIATTTAVSKPLTN